MIRLGAIAVLLALLGTTGCAVQDLFSGALGGRTSNEAAINRGGQDVGMLSPADGDGHWKNSTGRTWTP